METKWTPGPWEIAVERMEDLGCDHIWIAPASWVPRVARVVVYPEYEAEERANAHLIAAAPNLYAALAEVAGSLHQTARDRDLSEGELSFMRRVDAVLSKARGEA